MKLLLHILIFVLIALSSANSLDTKNEDACARIAIEYQKSNKDPEFSANYSDVKACLES
ncbi:12632_t:CDS:1, partial [Funneliformis caledonium]